MAVAKSESETTVLPRSRAEAKARREVRYYTGEPCKRGHRAPRYASTTQCAECQKGHYRAATGCGERPAPAAMFAAALEIIAKHGGVCISDGISNAKDCIQVQCGARHPPFETNYDRLQQGKWCRTCWRDRSRGKFGYTIDDMKRVAVERGGECRAKQFLGVKTKIEFWCPKHGSFMSPPDAILNNGRWCPACGEERKGREWRPVQDMLAYIKERGGSLVTRIEKYRGMKTRVSVRCANGHTWRVTVSSLLHAKSWCPNCRYAGEATARLILEATYGVSFPKVRPAFLRTDGGGVLELDGYNEDLRLAFEYQGPLHDGAEQGMRDALKRELCVRHGVTIIEIPFVRRPFPPEVVRVAVAKALAPIDDREVLLPEGGAFPQKLELLRNLAVARGGELVSPAYAGESGLHVWKCETPEHPPWKAAPSSIKKGTWCAHCAGVAKRDRGWLAAFGTEHALALLSPDYLGANASHRWRCKAGHEFNATKGNILQGVTRGRGPCARCAGKRRKVTIDDLRELAAARGGQCLEEMYVGAGVQVKWKCGSGHEFDRTWNTVQQGRWCKSPGCGERRNWGIWR